MTIAGTRGFALIEVLVSLLILSVGILGAGALQLVGLQTNQGAYYRSQAMYLASDMLDRMRGNRAALASYGGVDTALVTVASAPACLSASGGCTPAQMAAADINEWTTYFKQQNVLPEGRGQIALVGGAYVISVRWSETDWAANNTRTAQGQVYSVTVNIRNI